MVFSQLAHFTARARPAGRSCKRGQGVPAKKKSRMHFPTAGEIIDLQDLVGVPHADHVLCEFAAVVMTHSRLADHERLESSQRDDVAARLLPLVERAIDALAQGRT